MRFRRAEETHKPFNGHTGKMLVNVRSSLKTLSHSLISANGQADAPFGPRRRHARRSTGTPARCWSTCAIRHSSSNSTSMRRQADALPARGGNAQAVQPSQTLNPKPSHQQDAGQCAQFFSNPLTFLCSSNGHADALPAGGGDPHSAVQPPHRQDAGRNAPSHFGSTPYSAGTAVPQDQLRVSTEASCLFVRRVIRPPVKGGGGDMKTRGFAFSRETNCVGLLEHHEFLNVVVLRRVRGPEGGCRQSSPTDALETACRAASGESQGASGGRVRA